MSGSGWIVAAIRVLGGSPATGGVRRGTAIDENDSGTGRGAQPSGTSTPAPATSPVDRTGYQALRSVLRIRPFRRLWLVLGAASFGDWLGLLATSVFASSQVTGDTAKGLAFGGVIAVRLLPALVLGPVAGVLADRFDRRITMVICDLLRFVLFASIPLAALLDVGGGLVVGWAAVATFLIEAITLIWIPAKEAAVPNLIPRTRLEVANQLTLITTYGLTPVLAAVGAAVLDRSVRYASGGPPQGLADPTQLALYFNSLSRLATALVVFFGIREISGRRGRRESVEQVAGQAEQAEQSMLRQFVEGWRFIGKTPLVRGLVLGIFGAFAGGGVVIGTANFFTKSLAAGEAAFYLLFGSIFLGLSLGIGLGPMIVREMSRRRWFGMSIVLASASVLVLAGSIHLSMAILGAVLVGAGAGMAFLAGTTLLGGEIADELRGRVFAVVQTGTRLVLILAISVSSLLVGVGGSWQLRIADLGISVSSTRLLLLVAGAAGIFTGIKAFRQMDDKPGVPVLPDLWGSIRGRPLFPAEPFASSGVFVVFEGGEGAGKSTQVDRLAEALRQHSREVVVTREPGATGVGEQIRGLVLGRATGPESLAPRAEALLYAADRAHHVATVVRPALARGAVVISDRYVDSSLAYQGAGRTLPVEEISWLSSWATGGLKPDLVVLLDIEPRTGLARVDFRGGSPDRLEGESIDFHDRVRYAFLDLAASDPKRYLVLDASRPADEIAAAVADRATGMLADPEATVHPEPARPPDTSSRPELSEAELHAGADDDGPAPQARLAGRPGRTPEDSVDGASGRERTGGSAGGVELERRP
ncbi:dTMP kinase [Plantactinospora sp. S1510]|uniref:Thymidylate kinase n=1 Tax=Plantactinospora alkalitolerans TaxID=2789879 RepID=A0ABS0H9P8_9ACTN|nr:dTMP kinase [Plantactinospora alkalitolerans]